MRVLLIASCWVVASCDFIYEFPIVGTACENGVLNSDPGGGGDPETDVDCGGSCPKCADGRNCKLDRDCRSDYCLNGKCAPGPACTDGVKNGMETDVDCGGTCPSCGDRAACLMARDCQSGLCVNNVCAPLPTCTDGLQNGAETDLDCGGTCPKCGDHLGCNTPDDCQSGQCESGKCQPLPTCTDGVRNGAETDVDCGGGGSDPCPRCADYKECLLGGDCDSKVCKERVRGNHTCEPNSCSDKIHNGSETDVDCGGRCSQNCQTGQLCKSNSDCTSAVCNSGVCT